MPSALLLPVLVGFQALWWIVPGLAAALWLRQRKAIDVLYVVPVAAIISAVISYGAFWAYFAGSGWGKAYTVVVAGVSLALAFWLFKHAPSAWKTVKKLDVCMPLLLWGIISLLYVSTTFGCSTARPVMQSDQLCHVHGITFDNLLPQLFADNVYDGRPRQLIGDWQGSDRPPLQSGAVLLQSPLTFAPSLNIAGYQILATLLQVLWVPAVWIMGRRLRFSAGQMGAVLLLLTCTGFFFFNSVFTWPKLLAGGLVMFGFALLFFEKPARVRWALAGLAFAGAFLAHGGVIFTLVPMGAILFLRHFRKNPQLLGVLAAAFGLLVLPWWLYQKLYDPPGDRLIKWHVGGVVAIDQRPAPELIVDSYEQAGPGEIAHNKADNIRTIFGDVPPEGLLYGEGTLASIRDAEFRYVLFGLGLLNAGWIMVLMPSVRRRLQQTKLDGQRLQLLFTVALASLLAWALVLFGPDITVIHQGSYATMLLLFIALAAVVTRALSPLLLKLLLTLQVSYFILVWVLSVWAQHSVNYGYIAWAIAGAAGLAVCLYKLREQKI